MRITKKCEKYIDDFAEKAAKIFLEYGFTYGFEPDVKPYVPTKEELSDKIRKRVLAFDPHACNSSLTGRILIARSDFEFGFRLFLDLKKPIMSCVETVKGEKKNECLSKNP